MLIRPKPRPLTTTTLRSQPSDSSSILPLNLDSDTETSTSQIKASFKPLLSSIAGTEENAERMDKQILASYWGDPPQIIALQELLTSWRDNKLFLDQPRQRPLAQHEARVVNYAREDLLLVLHDLQLLLLNYIKTKSLEMKNSFKLILEQKNTDKVENYFNNRIMALLELPKLMTLLNRLMHELQHSNHSYVCIVTLKDKTALLWTTKLENLPNSVEREQKEFQASTSNTQTDRLIEWIYGSAIDQYDKLLPGDQVYLLLLTISSLRIVPSVHKLECWKTFSEYYLSQASAKKKSSALASFCCFKYEDNKKDQPFILNFFSLISKLDMKTIDNHQVIHFIKSLRDITPTPVTENENGDEFSKLSN